MSREVVCARCLFPIRRGKIPIIWPHKDGGRVAYCSVACLEADSHFTIPEPNRSMQLEVEKGGDE